MKKNIFTIILLLKMTVASLSQIKIGIGTSSPHSDAALELASTNQGFLPPRLALTNTTLPLPMNNFVPGMLLFNTTNTGNVSSGYYVSNGQRWQPLLATNNNSNKWNLLGNAGTNSSINFIGNTDGQVLGFKRNNLRSGLLDYSNTSWGNNALNPNTSGQYHTAIGASALEANTTGISNSAFGYNALKKNTEGASNVAIGKDALFSNLIGSNNVAVGYQAGYSSVGNGNVFLGAGAGYFETGNDKLYINNKDDLSPSSLIYGEFANQKLQLNNKLGIGKLPAISALEIAHQGAEKKLFKFFNSFNSEIYHSNILADGSLNFAYTGFADNRLVLAPGIGLGMGRIPNGYPLEIRGIFDNSELIALANKNEQKKWHINLADNGLNFVESNVADNRLFLAEWGDVGINTIPTADVEIEERSNVYAPPGSATNPNAGLKLERKNSTDSWNILIEEGLDLNFNYNGVTLGYIGFGGIYTSNSDLRVKDNIQPFENVLDKVLQLKPQAYHYLDQADDAPLAHGFLAQDVEQLFPSFVSTKGEHNSKAIEYQNFSVLAIQAIKEQQKQLANQADQITKQDSKIAEQYRKMKMIETALAVLEK